MCLEHYREDQFRSAVLSLTHGALSCTCNERLLTMSVITTGQTETSAVTLYSGSLQRPLNLLHVNSDHLRRRSAYLQSVAVTL